ncbi:MAG: hypothetical protein ACFE8M_04465 [Candidatus Hermodarchaeota archaeon]
MTEAYADFMIFELEDTGERQQLSITEQEFCQNNGNGVLHPYQVAIIVKEDLRRIYIWKGFTSSVRKKFIASRVASELQQELVTNAGFHRCKVISVDQGDEPGEFLNAFGFEKQSIQEMAEIKQPEVKKDLKLNARETHQKNPLIKSINNSKSFVSKSFKLVKSEKKSREIFEKIIQNEVPNDYKRKNILTGHSLLYGEIFKKVNIFGERIEEREWQPVSKLPKEIFELEGHKLRIHFNNEIGMIEAIEVLEIDSRVKPKKEDKREEKIDYNKWTVKQLKTFCSKNKIKIPSTYRKADIIHLVNEFTKP